MDKEHEYTTLRDEANTTKKFVFERTFIIAALTIAVLNFYTLYALMIPISLLTLFINYWFIIYRIRSHARIVGYTKVFLENEDEYFGWETYLERYRLMKESTKKQLKKKETTKKKDTENQSEQKDTTMKNPFVFWITFYHTALILLITVYSTLVYWNIPKAFIQIKSNTINLTDEQISHIFNILFGITEETKFLFISINAVLCMLMIVYVMKIFIYDKITLCNLYEIKIAESIRTTTPRPWRKKRYLQR
jgi:hypothetical protein